MRTTLILSEIITHGDLVSVETQISYQRCNGLFSFFGLGHFDLSFVALNDKDKQMVREWCVMWTIVAKNVTIHHQQTSDTNTPPSNRESATPDI
jgi:hypothetical protein